MNKCIMCECELNEDNAFQYEYEDGLYCESCYNEYFRNCDQCSHIIDLDNEDYTVYDSEYYCEDCNTEYLNTCEHCGETIHRDDTCYCENRCYCGRCFNNHCGYCEDCDTACFNEDLYYCESEDSWYCSDCMRERDDNMSIIREYHERDIDIRFKKLENEDTKLFYGFELEVENNDFNISNSESADYIRDNFEDLELCFERDGSLNDGYEIISQPMTFNYILENKEKFKSILEYLAKNGFKSHNGGRCGLHIHISKNALGKNDDMIQKNIDKLLLFTETYKTELSKFSRRTDFHYCNFLSSVSNSYNENKYFKSTKILKEEHKKINRYQVINTENSNTIEFRIFRGTLKFETFFATLCFIDNLINTVLKNSISKINWDKVINYNKYDELLNYINEKCLYNSTYMCDETKNIEKEYNLKLEKLEKLNQNYIDCLNNIIDKTISFMDELNKDIIIKDIKEDNLTENTQKLNVLGNLQKSISRNLYKTVKKDLDKSFYNIIKSNYDTFKNYLNDFVNAIISDIRYENNCQTFIKELYSISDTFKKDIESEEV